MVGRLTHVRFYNPRFCPELKIGPRIISRGFCSKASLNPAKINVLSCGRETAWEAFLETTWARAIASQKLSRDNGETIFAARHQDVSQGPLGCEARAVG